MVKPKKKRNQKPDKNPGGHKNPGENMKTQTMIKQVRQRQKPERKKWLRKIKQDQRKIWKR
ncbi:hypothetical protein HYD80_03995 [Mycoplasmopsis bovis]|nr:hypothetical protein [Mycoplasmopsis bovis]QQH42944.1 hypothetical protein HYD80_03995 [Mycoplasmopsis bovis]